MMMMMMVMKKKKMMMMSQRSRKQKKLTFQRMNPWWGDLGKGMRNGRSWGRRVGIQRKDQGESVPRGGLREG